MYIKELTVKDYDGNSRTTTLTFHLNEVELVDLEIDKGPKGILGYVEKIRRNEDKAEAIRFIKDLIKKSYGVKSEDGQRFVKSETIWEDFSQTAAYPAIFSLLTQSEVELEAFMLGIVPAEYRKEMTVKKGDRNEIDTTATPINVGKP